MLRVNRVINRARASISNCQYLLSHDPKISPSPPQHFASKSSIRFFDIYKLASKEKIKKERARLADELNRGYFDNTSDLKQHGGKVFRGPGHWANEFGAERLQQESVDDQWVNEFSKLHVDDWAEEFGRQVGEGALGDSSSDNWANSYDEDNVAKRVVECISLFQLSCIWFSLTDNLLCLSGPGSILKNQRL